MAKILVVGAGRVGSACVKIIAATSNHEIVVADYSESALDNLHDELLRVEQDKASVSYFLAYDTASLETIFKNESPNVVICSTPFTVNLEVARLAAAFGVSYIDFTEDTKVTDEISKLDVKGSTFVPQTGLAPGLISYLGLELFDKLGIPHELKLRVGALPRSAFGPEHYAITWSVDGLINEYLNPAFRKRNGAVETVAPLTEHETVVVGGTLYEGFTTSGGVGSLGAYDSIPNVEYKTLRYPGHLTFIKDLLQRTKFDLQLGVNEAKKVFNRTRDDVVVLLALASDVDGLCSSVGLHFSPHAQLRLTALELTTAGIGVAVAELILGGQLPGGILKPNQIPMAMIRTTAAHQLIFSVVNQ